MDREQLKIEAILGSDKWIIPKDNDWYISISDIPAISQEIHEYYTAEAEKLVSQARQEVINWLEQHNKYPQVKGLVLTVEDWQDLKARYKEEE